MKRYFFIFIIVYASVLQGATQLHLNTLLRDVIKRNPDLAATRARVQAAVHVIPRVQALDDPQFVFRTINNEIGSKRGLIPAERRYKIRQTFPFPGKLRLRGEIAEHQHAFLQSAELTTQDELIMQAKKLYYLLSLNKSEHSINKQNRVIILRLIDGALALYKTGRSEQVDVLKAQIELQLLDEELLTLESEKETFSAMINVLLNRQQSVIVNDPQEFFHPQFPLHYEFLERIALRERPELHGIQATIDEQEAAARLAKREYYPDFTFEFMIQDRPDIDKRSWGINIEFNIPLWVNKKQKQELYEAEAHALANRFSLQNMRSQIGGRIRELLAKIEAAEERIVLYDTGLVPKTAETLASQESLYRVGKITFLTVLDTRRQFQNAEIQYERARIEREILLAELEREIGGSLQEIMYSSQEENVPLVNLFSVMQQGNIVCAKTVPVYTVSVYTVPVYTVPVFDAIKNTQDKVVISKLQKELWGDYTFKREGCYDA